MTIPAHSLLLKIYVGEKFFTKGIPMYEEILWKAKQLGLGGCTVIKCEMGLGHTGAVESRDQEKHDDLPVLIEIVDSQDKINHFIPVATKILGNHGLITVNEVTVFHQGSLYKGPHAGDPEHEIKSYD